LTQSVPAAPYKTTRLVEFADTDAAGIVHFTALFRMMEEAEHRWRRERGLSVMSRDGTTVIGWPRVSARCDFLAAARFEDLLEIEVRLARLGERSVTFAFTFTLDGTPIAQGEMSSVCCRLVEGSPPESIPIPDAVRSKLEA
jgi:4-hydroxybenzoyl-CoA thioesterase/acyl-CoA thioester hydrolase